MDFSSACSAHLEALSAAADAELAPSEQRSLAAHLEHCASCRQVAEEFAALTRRVRLQPAPSIPDLVPAVMSRARPARLGRGGWMRPALAWVAVVIGFQSLHPLMTSTVDGVTTHAARHVGAFALALAVGCAYVAWRPHRAFGLLPFAAALVVTTLAAAILDTVTQRSSAISESVHVTEMCAVLLVWMIAGSPGWERLVSLGWRLRRRRRRATNP